MRITKLHLLGIILIIGLAVSGKYYFSQKKNEMIRQQEAARLELAEKKRQEEEAFQNAAQQTPEPVAASTAPAVNLTPVEYTVQKGDTLWKIAKDPAHFGQGHRWYDIWKENEDKILDFDHLPAGLLINIPLDKPEGYDWPPTSPERKRTLLSRPLRRKVLTTN